jgi:hypothetical protein
LIDYLINYPHLDDSIEYLWSIAVILEGLYDLLLGTIKWVLLYAEE